METIIPLCDEKIVRSSEIQAYRVVATLYMRTAGPGQSEAESEAVRRVSEFTSRKRRQGASVWRDKISSLLHVEGVTHVDLQEPASDLLLTAAQAATCLDIVLTVVVDPDND
ncbi:hypothetical protein D3C71_1871690 [compost metagenome]